MSDQFHAWGATMAPLNQEAEEATLGAVLAYPAAYALVAALLKAEDFFIVRHRYIWEAFTRLYQRGEPLDYLVVVSELRDMGRLDEIGGPAYLTQLINNTPSAVHAEVYSRLVLRTAHRRRLMAAADEIKALALNLDVTLEDVIKGAYTRLNDAAELSDQRGTRPFFEIVRDYFDKVENRLTNGQMPGLPTGFTSLDSLLGGLHKTDLILLGGRPGMGKTALALSTIFNILRADPQKRIALFSLEMNAEQVAQRAISMQAGLNVQALRLGTIGTAGWSKFVKASGEIAPYQLFVDERSSLSPLWVRTELQKLVRQGGPLDLVVVDYVQLMEADADYGAEKRVAEISYISRHLKQIAREFDVPVLAVCSLNRALEARADKRPILSDLRDSGQLESDADVVLFTYRDEVYNEVTEFPNMGEIICAKHRNGPTGTVTLFFEKTLAKWLNAAERSVDLSHI
ncbi:MAG: replicative DNA helicase [Anaerolineae bacterium]|nr:replicative DNA helicase [Anaerolineae bacterium]